MAQTKEGAAKATARIKELHGADYFKLIGAMGGKKTNPNKGFGSNRALARKAGAKGGRISRRTA